MKANALRHKRIICPSTAEPILDPPAGGMKAGGDREQRENSLTFWKACAQVHGAEQLAWKTLLRSPAPKQAPVGPPSLKNCDFLTPNIDWNCLNAGCIRRMKALHASGRRGLLLNRGPDRRMGEPALLSLLRLIPYEPHRRSFLMGLKALY